jgi:hypothetical protein
MAALRVPRSRTHGASAVGPLLLTFRVVVVGAVVAASLGWRACERSVERALYAAARALPPRKHIKLAMLLFGQPRFVRALRPPPTLAC